MKVINEDGTSMDDFPKNPLKEKWNRFYPPTPKAEYSQVCDGYSCMWCDRCPNGTHWEVPEEDKKEYEEYQQQIVEYHKIHNPTLYAFYNPSDAITDTLKDIANDLKKFI